MTFGIPYLFSLAQCAWSLLPASPLEVASTLHVLQDRPSSSLPARSSTFLTRLDNFGRALSNDVPPWLSFLFRLLQTRRPKKWNYCHQLSPTENNLWQPKKSDRPDLPRSDPIPAQLTKLTASFKWRFHGQFSPPLHLYFLPLRLKQLSQIAIW